MRSNGFIRHIVWVVIGMILSTSQSHAQADTTSPFHVTYINEDQVQFNSIGRQALLQNFTGKDSAFRYIHKLRGIAEAEGYLYFSIDSMMLQDHDVKLQVFIGPPVKSLQLNITDLKRLTFLHQLLDEKDSIAITFLEWKILQQKILDACENNGYPFAAAGLKDVLMDQTQIRGTVKVEESVFYRIDSISVKGNAKIKNSLLKKHLFIQNGMPYAADKIRQVDRRISTLGYVSAIQPSDVSMLGSGAVLNLYLKPKKTSQFNFLVGLQPENGGKKIRLTGDLNADFRNLFGSGEQLLFKWQQLQPLSPRLNIGYAQPYVFNSAFGIDTRFGLFKKDSSFLQLNAAIGTTFVFDAHQQGGAMLSWQSNRLLNGAVDTNLIIATRRLPQDIDMSLTSLGIHYQWDRTDYLFNPRKGTYSEAKAQAGIKTISINNDILNIRTPGFNAAQLYDTLSLNDYQIRLQASAAHYFPVGKLATIKTALQGGAVISRSVFRNECFQIGGSQLLRGFDAESIFAINYLIGTAEYRLLFAKDAYFSIFTDYARADVLLGKVKKEIWFMAAGSGLQYQTKSGLLNLSIAAGKRSDIMFDYRSALKFHFGFVNYF